LKEVFQLVQVGPGGQREDDTESSVAGIAPHMTRLFGTVTPEPDSTLITMPSRPAPTRPTTTSNQTLDTKRIRYGRYLQGSVVARVEPSPGVAGWARRFRFGFPGSGAVIERSRRSSGGTMAALAAALAGDGVAVNLAGGTHHAGYDRGGGYCVFNDSVIAARYVQAHGLARRVLVVDLDVHQGNGTADLARGDESIFAFSMHAARNYPAIKPASDLDVPLPDGTDDAGYLDALAAALPLAIARSRPEAVIYLAGADPYAGDRLGHLALTKAGLAERDRQVLAACRRAGIPVAVTMGGGYAPDVEDIVDIHAGTVRLAAAIS